MSTSNPTPNPEPERQPAYDAVYAVIRRYPPRSADDYNASAENGRIWRAVEAALDAMDLPARDARIRAEALRSAHAKTVEVLGLAPLPTFAVAAIESRLHDWLMDQIEAGNATESPAAGSVVSTEGSVHPQPASVRLLLPQPVLSLDTPEGDTDANH